MQLEQGRAAPEGDVVREKGMCVNFHQRPANDQVLFHLIVPGPGNLLPPFVDIGDGDHRSGSTWVFTKTRQRLSILAPLMPMAGARGVRNGRFWAMYPAIRS